MDDESQQTVLPYRHTQVGLATLIGLGAGFLTQLGKAVRDVRKHRSGAWFSVPLTVGFVALMAVFSSLKVAVDEATLVASFTGGALTRRIAVEEIASAEVVRIPWHHGWGMRRTGHGWLYNVWGRQAVRLHMTDESTFTIGSDEPEALLAAIEQARAQRAPAVA
jgi:hypothetical protein